MRRLFSLLLALSLLTSTAHGYTVLRNDSFEPGDGVAFYLRIGLEEAFASVYDIPAGYPEYRICRVLAFIGPAGGFNIYSLRIGIAGDDGGEIGPGGAGLIWQTDLDAYQVFGSENQFASFDLAPENIVTDTQRLRVQLRVVTQENSPNIATDADGITPESNFILVRLRNGQSFVGFTELMNPEGSPPQPGGDWILRTEIVRLDEECPDPNAPPPDPEDAGPPDEIFDLGMPPAPDMGGDEVMDRGLGEDDAAVDLDAGVEPDARVVPDARMEPDAAPTPDTGGMVGGDDARVPPDARPAGDRGPTPGGDPLELTRIVPDRGPGDRNTEVLINGRGFLDGGGLVRAEIGETRLLELDVMSGSTVAALVPAGLDAGTYDLRLIRNDGQVAVLPSAFTVDGAPPAPLMLRAVEPESIAAGSTAELSVLGAGLTANTEFSVGGAPLEDVVVDATGETARGTLTVNLSTGVYDVVARRGDDVARLERALEVRGSRGEPDGCASAPGGSTGWPLLLIGLVAVCLRRR